MVKEYKKAFAECADVIGLPGITLEIDYLEASLQMADGSRGIILLNDNLGKNAEEGLTLFRKLRGTINGLKDHCRAHFEIYLTPECSPLNFYDSKDARHRAERIMGHVKHHGVTSQLEHDAYLSELVPPETANEVYRRLGLDKISNARLPYIDGAFSKIGRKDFASFVDRKLF